MTGSMLAAVVVGGVISWVGCFAARRWAPAWGLVDAPDDRKTHAAATPLGGGLAIGLGVLAALLVVGRFESSAWLLAGGGAMLALGLVDDRWEISWKRRLAIELLVAGSLAAASVWPPASGAAGLWRPVLAALWIAALLNAVNMLDNMDALAAGVAAVAAAFLAALILWTPPEAARGQNATAPVAESNPADALAASPVAEGAGATVCAAGGLDPTLPLAMFGALVGFLWHNRSPARLFMGDAGSYFVGFLLGAISVLAIAAAGGRPWPSRFAPVCALGAPLYDMVSVTMIRLVAGRSPFAADRNHVSHRLVALGLEPRQAVLALCVASCACGIAALVVQRASRAVGMTTVAGLATAAVLAGAGEFLARRKKIRREPARR